MLNIFNSFLFFIMANCSYLKQLWQILNLESFISFLGGKHPENGVESQSKNLFYDNLPFHGLKNPPKQVSESTYGPYKYLQN